MLTQADRFKEQVTSLLETTESVYSNSNGQHEGAFTNPKVLLCHKPMEVDEVHKVEAFGPMTTVMPYESNEEAIQAGQQSRRFAGGFAVYGG
ncbi:MAG: aldehyde dehydrogenase family protein [Fodinibius sp.]|nr:aldehyde dehydrogenase family protein [Fodinibius sp.]